MPQVKELRGDHTVSLPVSGMAAPGTDNEQAAVVVPFNAKVTGVKWLPSAAVTSAATNFSTLSVRNRGAAGSGTPLPASRSYNTGNPNSVAWVAEDMTLSGTASDLLVSAGDVLTVQMIHSGTGIQIPAGVVRISLQVR